MTSKGRGGESQKLKTTSGEGGEVLIFTDLFLTNFQSPHSEIKTFHNIFGHEVKVLTALFFLFVGVSQDKK